MGSSMVSKEVVLQARQMHERGTLAKLKAELAEQQQRIGMELASELNGVQKKVRVS